MAADTQHQHLTAPSVALTREHPLRRTLAHELHARPYGRLTAPARISFLAFFSEEGRGQEDWSHVRALCRGLGAEEPADGARHHTFRRCAAHVPARSAGHGDPCGASQRRPI